MSGRLQRLLLAFSPLLICVFHCEELTLTNLLLSCWFKSVSMFLYHKNIRAAVPAFFAAIESYPYISMVSDVVQVSNDLELNCQVRSHRSNQIILLTNGSYEIESLDFLHSSLVGIGEKVQITFRSSIVKTIWRRHLMANLSLNFESSKLIVGAVSSWSR